MKSILKFLASRVNIETYERLLAYSILAQAFNEIRSAQTFARRDQVWDRCIEMCGGVDSHISFVEFGVHTGHSMEYFVRKNTNSTSTFIGLDSFEGLPESWGSLQKSFFDTGGKSPRITDKRVSFIKGWFQDTYIELLQTIPTGGQLIVHYDADLYSSTLFCLCKMDELKRRYLAVFDEFFGHEQKALYDYSRSHRASVTFLGKTLWKRATGSCPL